MKEKDREEPTMTVSEIAEFQPSPEEQQIMDEQFSSGLVGDQDPEPVGVAPMTDIEVEPELYELRVALALVLRAFERNTQRMIRYVYVERTSSPITGGSWDDVPEELKQRIDSVSITLEERAEKGDK